MDKMQESVNEALPCPHCGNQLVSAETCWCDARELDLDPSDITEYLAGRFRCVVCGASTKHIPLDMEDEPENSETWGHVLAAWNLRVPMVSGHAAPSPAPRPRPETRDTPPRAPRAPSQPARARPEKPPVSSRVNPLQKEGGER